GLAMPISVLKHEGGALAGGQGKVGGSCAVFYPQWDLAAQPQAGLVRTLAMEQNLLLALLQRVAGAAIVESRVADHATLEMATDGLGASHDTGTHAPGSNRHEIGYFQHAFLGQEPGQKDIGVGEINLLLLASLEQGGQGEATAFGRVQQRGKDGRRIKLREAHEVDRAVHGDQGDGIKVADDTIAADWFVSC